MTGMDELALVCSPLSSVDQLLCPRSSVGQLSCPWDRCVECRGGTWELEHLGAGRAVAGLAGAFGAILPVRATRVAGSVGRFSSCRNLRVTPGPA